MTRRPAEHGLGFRLRKAREAKGLSLRQLALRCLIAPNTLSSFENNSRLPNAVGFRQFMNVGISANWLLSGRGPMFVDEDERDA